MKHIAIALQAFFLTITFVLSAQQAHLVKDINTTTESTVFGQSFAVLNDIMYFSADNQSGLGPELWCTDGTPVGTFPVKDIRPGEKGSVPDQFIVASNRLFFMARDGEFDDISLLYTSDGTSAGTKRFEPLTIPTSSIALNDKFYYLASSFNGQQLELWVTDGTNPGTALIYQSQSGYYPTTWINKAGNLFYFIAVSDAGKQDLWRSDGTAQGTFILHSAQGSDAIANPGPVGSKLFFWANAGAPEGYGLWVTDGSLAGTNLVKDLEPGNYGGFSLAQTSSDAHLYFRKAVNGTDQFWKSDGTQQGTIMIDPNPPFSNIFKYTDGKIYCAESGILVSDGNSPFVLLTDPLFYMSAFGNNGFFPFQNKVYFSLETNTKGYEPWVSDGTIQGTGPMTDFYEGVEGSNPFIAGVLNNKLIWTAKDKLYGREFRTLNATDDLDLMVDLNTRTASSEPYTIFPTPEITFISADDGFNGKEMWTYDESTGEADLVEIFPGMGSSSPEQYRRMGDYLFFSAYDTLIDNELWSRKFSTGALQKLTSAIPGYQGFYPESLTECNNLLYINAGVTALGTIYASDGTPANTNLVVNGIDLHPNFLTCFNGDLYFATANAHFYRCDGTATGTTILKSFTVGPNQGEISLLTQFDNKLFFRASDLEHGVEIWTSDGTTANTTVFLDMYPGTGSSNPDNFRVVGDKMFFTATNNAAFEKELWVTDGTVAGTYPLTVIESPQIITPISHFLPGENLLYFILYKFGTSYAEVWRTDGTVNGTFILRSFSDPSTSLQINTLVWHNDLYFRGFDQEHGNELWISDGTVDNTRLLEDICPGKCSSYPVSFAYLDSTIYFAAYRTDIGIEPWYINAQTTTTKNIPEHALDITIYGNPLTDNILRLNVSLPEAGTTDFKLWSVNGAMVWNRQQEPGAGKNMLEFVLPQLVPGLYFLEISSEKFHDTAKIVISR